MPLRHDQVRQARAHLRRCDATMATIIDEVGPFTLRPERDRFWMLVKSIISQQISVGAARSIRNRLLQLIAPQKVTPEALLALSAEELRSAGISPQKARYLHDLAAKSAEGIVAIRSIGRFSDEKVIAELTQVKGVGRWTAQMFLIFALGRLDVFPEDDLGVRTAIRDRYGLDDLPDRQTALQVAAPWRPYATVASWYCWRALDVARDQKTFATGYPL